MSFISGVLGNKPPMFYFWAYFYASIGIGFYKLIQSAKRDRTYKFDIIYWLKDNTIEILTNFLLIYISARFTSQIMILAKNYFDIDPEILTTITDNQFMFLFIGVFHQVILQKLRKDTQIGGKIFKTTAEAPPAQPVTEAQPIP